MQHSPAVDASEPATLLSCRFAERTLALDERFEKWPSPNEMAAAMNREYRGQVDWLDVDKDPPDDIIVMLEVDADDVLLRYPISAPRPGTRGLCKSSLVVRFDVELRLAEEKARVSTAYATYDIHIGAHVPISVEFAALFAAPNGDAFTVGLNMSLDGRSVGGRFVTSDSSYRQAGVFVAQ